MTMHRLTLLVVCALAACTNAPTVPGPPGVVTGPDAASTGDGEADVQTDSNVDGTADATGPDAVGVDVSSDTSSADGVEPPGDVTLDASDTPSDQASGDGGSGDSGGADGGSGDSGGTDSADAGDAGPGLQCLDDTACPGDSHCVDGQCVPYADGEVNEDCAKLTAPGVFFPALQCEWSGPPEGDDFPDHRNVLGSPTVVNFPFAPNPSGAPGESGHIVFVSYALTDGGIDSGNCCGVIRVIDGGTCEQVYSLDAHFVVGGSNPAIGDLDLDGHPDIVALAEGGGLVAFAIDINTQQFVLKWHSTEPDGVTLDTFADGQNRWNGPSLADITGDAFPEVLYEGNVYNYNGVKLAPGLGWTSYQQGVFPIAADVDLDGQPEVMLGPTAYRFDIATQTYVAEDYVTTPPGNGHIALGDFGDWTPGMAAEAAEVVLVSAGLVSIQALDGTVFFGPYALPGGGNGGPPTIADFDGDGKPEFAAAGSTRYTVFDMDCVGTPLPAECESEGVLWSKLSQDQSSNKTGSSVFDFEADGKAEAVYGDECFVRTYDGTNGDVLYSGPRSSCTWHEQPVIADVDGDFRTEIVIGSNNNCSVTCPALDPIHGGLRCDDATNCVSGQCVAGLCRCTQDSECSEGYACAAMLTAEEDGQGQVCRAENAGKLQGIRVYRDDQDVWAQSRRIWNQHAYFVTNIDEDGRVPASGEVVPNWTQSGLNDFRRNSQGDLPALGASDLTVKAAEEALDCGDGTLIVALEACNRGTVPVGSGVPVQVFADAPSTNAVPVCSLETSEPLGPGECTLLSCEVSIEALPDGGFWTTIDDPFGTTGEGNYFECNEQNNIGASDYEGCQ